MDNNNNSNKNEIPESYLKALNKASLKITKPTRRTYSPDPNPLIPTQPQQPNQPPVYNIEACDFREVVQRLTGSLAHAQPQPPPPARQSSSRLQRIRPPPLSQIGNSSSGFMLPPLPTVHHAAESPVTAYMRVLGNSMGVNGGDVAVEPKESPTATYMRHLQNSVYARDLRAPAPVPHQQQQQRDFRAPAPVPPQQQQQREMDVMMDFNNYGNDGSNGMLNSEFPIMPVSPLPFGGCASSPVGGQYGMLGSPGCLLFSPTSGMPQLPPLSPLPSPRWGKGV